MWFLLVFLGGTTSQSGVAIDTRQVFDKEIDCLAARDAVREVAASPPSRSGYQHPQAYCIPRSAKIAGEGK